MRVIKTISSEAMLTCPMLFTMNTMNVKLMKSHLQITDTIWEQLHLISMQFTDLRKEHTTRVDMLTFVAVTKGQIRTHINARSNLCCVYRVP
jgi:hypothetical protein